MSAPLFYGYDVSTDRMILTHGEDRMEVPLNVMKDFCAGLLSGENVSADKPIEVGVEKLMVYLDPYGKIMCIVRGHPPFKGKPETLWVSDEIKAKRAALAAGDKA